MRIVKSRLTAMACGLTLGMSLVGCGGSEEIPLKEVPPAEIAPVKDQEATNNSGSLKTGAPAKGSSSGINFNPSQTDRAR